MVNALSIVIPTCGRDSVLVASIQQLLLLSAQADELLVIDQTSSHDADTEATLSGWDADGRIRWLRHQPPGVVGAMNRGLREAKGDVVLFLDDDIVPGAELVAAHRQAHGEFPDAWAVVGQVIQGVDCRPQTAGHRPENKTEDGRQKTEDCSWLKEIVLCLLRLLRLPLPPQSALRKDLDFKFNGTEPAWVENVMAGNLSVKREKALAIGGFDENFVPPVSFRFETDFAKRIVAAGGQIRFEPKASILHLRATSGGTRSQGAHMASASPLHGVGDYYYAMKHGKGWDRLGYMLRRPFREVCTRFHWRHPWWIPVKFVGEIRAIWMAKGIWEKC